jgi:phosphoribosylanthranilate isomerase
MAKVKICGLIDPDMVGFCARAGADWIGFVFAPSPRRVTLEAAASLLLHVGKARPVALLVDPDDAEIAAVAALGFPVLQLHGQESPDRVAAIRAATGCEVWKAFGVETAVNLALTRHYTDADGYLIDARPPKGAPAGRSTGQFLTAGSPKSHGCWPAA